MLLSSQKLSLSLKTPPFPPFLCEPITQRDREPRVQRQLPGPGTSPTLGPTPLGLTGSPTCPQAAEASPLPCLLLRAPPTVEAQPSRTFPPSPTCLIPTWASLCPGATCRAQPPPPNSPASHPTTSETITLISTKSAAAQASCQRCPQWDPLPWLPDTHLTSRGPPAGVSHSPAELAE